MSGGHFNYNQYKLRDLYEELEDEITKNKHRDTLEYKYSKKTIRKFEKAIKLLKEAHIYVQRIDWLLSGDDGEETFHERLKEELEEIK